MKKERQITSNSLQFDASHISIRELEHEHVDSPHFSMQSLLLLVQLGKSHIAKTHFMAQ